MKTTDFSKVLMIHCHTTGINFNGPDFSTGHQPLSVGLAVVDMNNYKIIDSYYSKVRFDAEKYSWNKKLESIHGFHLDDISDVATPSIREVQSDVALFLDKNFDIDSKIPLLGYNIISFHLPFLKIILDYNEPFPFEFDGRPIDLFPIIAIFGKYTINYTIEMFGVDQSEPLSSLQLVKNYLKMARL